MVTRLDRLARSTRDLLNILDTVAKAGAGFKSLILGRRYARPIQWNNDAFPAAARPVQSRKGR
jgi:hypothetical protein